MATIRDERESKAPPYGFVIFTDSFMSGWGGAEGGRSLYALAVANDDEALTVLRAGGRRSEMKRGRFVRSLPRLRSTDHLSIVDRHLAARWYTANAFAEES